jgi:hypothetical protein
MAPRAAVRVAAALLETDGTAATTPDASAADKRAERGSSWDALANDLVTAVAVHAGLAAPASGKRVTASARIAQ